MTEIEAWPDVQILGEVRQHQGARFSSQVDVEVHLSRTPASEWTALFDQALALDPDDRDSGAIRAGFVPMIWATASQERAITIEDSIRESVDVANLRYRSQWLPTLQADEVEALVHEAIAAERRAKP
jgi:hypothetical protein